MADILIYSYKTELALELVSAAQGICRKTDFCAAAAAINDENQARALAARGLKVVNINNTSINLADTAAVAEALAKAAEYEKSSILLLSSNRRGRELSGRIAEYLDAGCLTDVETINFNNGNIECTRNALGGATVATQSIASRVQVIAVSPGSFEPAQADCAAAIEEFEVEAKTSGIKLLEMRPKNEDTVDLHSARTLVAVGQGLEDKDDLQLAQQLADTLGGVLACSKPVATDRKWLSEDRIVGLSGQKCKPELAILLGISGQVQFMVGVRDARTIAAINIDENASIMKMADYILTADLKEVLPEFKRLLG